MQRLKLASVFAALLLGLAYGLNTAVSGGPVGRVVQASISAAQTSADPDSSPIPAGCRASVADPMFAGVDMDSSIVAASRLAMCDRVALMSAGAVNRRAGALGLRVARMPR